MDEQFVTHRYIPNCAKGSHNWKLVFKTHHNNLSWVKVCRRCDTVKSVIGSFDNDGQWIKRKQLDYGNGPGERTGDSPDGSRANEGAD